MKIERYKRGPRKKKTESHRPRKEGQKIDGIAKDHPKEKSTKRLAKKKLTRGREKKRRRWAKNLQRVTAIILRTGSRTALRPSREEEDQENSTKVT